MRRITLLEGRTPRRLITAAGALVLAAQLFVWFPRYALETPAADGDYDFPVYRRSAERVARGESAYEWCTKDRALPPNCLLYPPPFAAAIALAGRASPRSFQFGTYVLLLAGFWWYAAGLARLATGTSRIAEIALAGIALFLTPGLNITMSLGNLDLVVWAMVAWGLTSDRMAPLLAGAAALKIWPAVALAVHVAARPRSLRRVAVAMVAVAAFTVAMVGLRSFHDWIAMAVPTLKMGTLYSQNASAVALLDRAGVHLSPTITIGLPLAAAAAVAFVARRQAAPVRAAACAVAAVFFGTICWWYYAPILLIPAAAWLGTRRADQAGDPLPSTAGAV